jgi:ketosteroid isomerase-like protein
MSAADDVRTASQQFYAALNAIVRGDATPMRAIWSQGTSVSSMHPIGGREVGWDEVWKSFDQVSQSASNGHIALENQIVQAGTDMAYETGYEKGGFTLAGQSIDISLRVTNVYRRDADGWKIVHHHTDLSQAMLDVVSRLQRNA